MKQQDIKNEEAQKKEKEWYESKLKVLGNMAVLEYVGLKY